MQYSLLSNSPSCQTLDLVNGEAKLYLNWLSAERSQALFQRLYEEVDWQQSVLQIHGKACPIPRLNAWYGDPDCEYSYSGAKLPLLPWLEPLESIRQDLGSQLASQFPSQLSPQLPAQEQQAFNSVLVNLYRNGRDSVAWHSDDEAELGRNPVIASISLGAERRFVLKHKQRKDLASVDLLLPAGSLLLMSGETQHYWQHQVPKTTASVGPRINLTFRQVTARQR